MEVFNNDYSSELEKSKLTKASFAYFGAPVCGSPSYRLYMQLGFEGEGSKVRFRASKKKAAEGLQPDATPNVRFLDCLAIGGCVQGLSGFGAPISQQCLKAVYEVFICNRAGK